MERIIFLALLCLSSGGQVFAQNSQTNYNTKYVYILVIDGPRYSETYGEPSCKYSPILCDSLKHEGTFYADFRNNGPTFTVPGHTAIVTGTYQRISNAGTALPKEPNIFQYFLKATGKDSSAAYVVASKGKLDVLVNTSHKKWHDLYQASTYCGPNGNGLGYGRDDKTFAKVTELVRSDNPPQLMLINLLAVDVYGHANNWNKYLEAITQSDQYAAQLWQMIQANPVLRDQTTLLITNDHGRHLDGVRSGFVNHGCRCEGCRHISLLVLGPDTPKGVVVTEKAEMIDISKTIADILHFEIPTSKGEFLRTAFPKN
ncbi:MAG: alkaline phosphatase family protein [Flavobacteriia bacterium]